MLLIISLLKLTNETTVKAIEKQIVVPCLGNNLPDTIQSNWDEKCVTLTSLS